MPDSDNSHSDPLPLPKAEVRPPIVFLPSYPLYVAREEDRDSEEYSLTCIFIRPVQQLIAVFLQSLLFRAFLMLYSISIPPLS